MIGENPNNIVNFAAYCLKCVHWAKYQYEDPCNDCLQHPANTDSRKPVYFKEDPDAKNTERNKKNN